MLTVALFGLALAGDAPQPAPPKVDFAALPTTATARPAPQGDKPHPVQARLLSEADAAPAGGTVKLGVLLEQAEGWHTYWRSPGDIGLPTKITWKLPNGVTADPQVYPVPQRYKAEGMVSYGYDTQVLHTSVLHIPADAKGKLAIEADVEWLVCQTSCIPGSVHLTTSLTVGDAKPSAFVPLFEHYGKLSPTPADKLTTIKVRGVLDATPVAVDTPFRFAFVIEPVAGHTIKAPPAGTWPTLIPILGPGWFPTTTGVFGQPDGSIIAVVGGLGTPEPLPTDDAGGALLQVEVDGQLVATEASLPLPWGPKGAQRAPSPDPIWAKVGEPAKSAEPPKDPTEPAKPAPTDPPTPAKPGDATTDGVVEGGWDYVWIAYGLTFVTLAGYALSLWIRWPSAGRK